MAVQDHSRYRLQTPLSDFDGPYFMTKSLLLGCKSCKKELGMFFISTPPNLTPLLNRCIVEVSALTLIKLKNQVLIAQEKIDFEEGMAEVKELEVAEKKFYDRYENVSEKFKESMVESKEQIELLKVPRHKFLF